MKNLFRKHTRYDLYNDLASVNKAMWPQYALLIALILLVCVAA